ncbi:hypothetical protein JIG36_28460 [Actinoplanes sp. LDG1-06]|uniref:Uncharacterized protein n=1 Tax=Paractinoplanes ovalisporus TaxID=2810368 RepID=A0ABS2AJE8_9ACTN|nr:hypothetical protein [Actinoplanes ovalisporus]MBM2619493.1 hypothetical protein [Actinoplanes ovalisporus]
MLALCLCDPGEQADDGDVSITMLYQRLLENLAHRELRSQDRAAELVRKRLWELSVVAYGMFNRGSQYVTDEELGSDLTGQVRRSAIAQEVIRGFFFVHTSELDLHHVDARRSYEFLHATFGEFLLGNARLDRIRKTVQPGSPDDGEVRDAKPASRPGSGQHVRHRRVSGQGSGGRQAVDGPCRRRTGARSG